MLLYFIFLKKSIHVFRNVLLNLPFKIVCKLKDIHDVFGLSDMPYIERSADGKIIGLRTIAGSNLTEAKSLTDDEILDFLKDNLDNKFLNSLLVHSDAGLIRLLEDLINLLTKKNIILFTELPEKAQEKIIEREQIREKISSQNIIVEDIL